MIHMRGEMTEAKIQEMADQIRNIICSWNSGAPFYSMVHAGDLVVVIDERGYSVSDPKGRRPTVHRFYGEDVQKEA